MSEEFVLTVCAPIDDNNLRIISFCSGFGLKLGRFDKTKKFLEQSYKTKDISAPDLFKLCDKYKEENRKLKFTPGVPYGTFDIFNSTDADFTMISILNEGLYIHTCSIDSNSMTTTAKITYEQIENSNYSYPLISSSDIQQVKDAFANMKECAEKINDALFEKLPAKEV